MTATMTMTAPGPLALRNRSNAMRSTGPRTPEGKAIVATNAVRHALRSPRPVAGPGESAEAWEAHRAAIVEDLAPVGALEEALAERAALLLWRLGRVADYETSVIRAEQAKVDLGREPTQLEVARDEFQRRLKQNESRQALVAALPDLPPGRPIHAADAQTLLQMAIGGPDPAVPPKVAAAELLRRLAAEAEAVEVSLAEFLEHLAGQLEAQASLFRERLAEVEAVLSAAAAAERGCRSLPPAEVLDRVIRYETTLERSLSRTLAELRTRQAGRPGRSGAPPELVSVVAREVVALFGKNPADGPAPPLVLDAPKSP